ncbi:hypothetical protein GOODEAATRI_007344 [Goodea atripinnis]|uniref:GTP-binding protein 1 n=1 Tax=Goodea atripinnis TaxID=208336 RepID=A0ABV0MZF2_9TELE
MEASVATVRSMCEQLDSDFIPLRERAEAAGMVRDYLIRRRVGELDFLEVRVAVVGNVDAGKSTLLGVLTHGELDNGRGFARQKLFRHKHEMESGRTSSVGNDILGFDQEGQVVNKPDSHGGSLDWTKICEKSSKVITFIDLAGHEKYLKTTVFGMTGHLPDFCMLMGVGTVVSGTTLRGLIRLNDTMLLGPDPLGSFIAIAVKSIHRKRMPVKEVRGGQTASQLGSLRLKFWFSIILLQYPPDTRRWVGNITRRGDKASVHFRFIKTPEYLHCDQRLVFREGRTKAVGTITKVEKLHGHCKVLV